MNQALALLAGSGAVIGFLILLWRPRWVVVLILTMYPLEQLLQAFVPALIERRWLINVSVGVLALVAIATRFAKGERLLSGVINWVAVGCVTLYTLAWIGLIWTPNYEHATELMSGSLPRAVLFLGCLPLLLDDLRDFKRIAIALMVIGSTIAIMIMLHPSSSFTGGRMSINLGFMADHRTGRANPGALANLGGLIAITGVLVRFNTVTPLLNALRITAFVSGMGLAIVSGSRGQVIFGAAICVALFPLARQGGTTAQFFVNTIGFALVAACVGIMFLVFVGTENVQRWDVQKMFEASGGRLEMVTDLISAYIDQPSAWLFGLGTNAFPAATGWNLGYVHNILAESICEFGIVGGAVLGFILVTSYRSCKWLWRTHADDAELRSLAALICAQVLFAFIMMLKQSSFYVTPGILLWFVVVARIAAHERRMRVEDPAFGLVEDPDGHEGEPAGAGFDEYYDAHDYGEGHVAGG